MQKIKFRANDKERTARFNVKKARFECNVGYKDNDYKSQSRIVYGASIEELKVNVAKFEEKLAESIVTHDGITFGCYIDYYLTNIAPMQNVNNTIATKRSVLKKLPKEILSIPLKNLTAVHLQSFYNSLIPKSTTNSVKYAHEVIGTILNSAVKLGFIETNPNKNCTVKPFENGKKVYWSVDTCRQFLEFIKAHHKYHELYRPVLCLIFSGLRKGEALGILKSDFNSSNCSIHIHGQIAANADKGYQDRLKTKKSKRYVSIPKFVFDELVKFPNKNIDFAFTYKGKPWNSATFYGVFKRACTDFGYPDMTIKHLRSSFVKTSIQSNIPIKAIQVMLGHSKISTTMDIYGELTCEDTFQYADNISAAWKGA